MEQTPVAPGIRYVDAADFGLNPVAWMVVANTNAGLILTVEGIPFASVGPVGAPLPEDVIARSRESSSTSSRGKSVDSHG